MSEQKFIKIADSFFVDADYKEAFSKLGLTSIDRVFCFNAGMNLSKSNLAGFRCRIQFEIDSPAATFFLKRYDKPPILTQFKNWLSHRKRISCGFGDFEPAEELLQAGINTPKTIAYGEEWGTLFEKRSFIVTKKIPADESLEKKLPECFYSSPTEENLKLRRKFIAQLAVFVKQFHQTGFRHRDLYLAHIFHSADAGFHLIDLARAFRPVLLSRRYQIKDIAQIHYSALAKYFSASDRLRFYLAYTDQKRLTTRDKQFVRQVIAKAKQMERHDKKHGRNTPFAGWKMRSRVLKTIVGGKVVWSASPKQ